MSMHKPTIALLAIPEVAASTLYGIYDVFASAGRDWPALIEGKAGESLFMPRVVARSGTREMTVANGVRVVPDAGLDWVPDVVCIPEIALPPEAVIEGRYSEEVAWLKRCHAEGAILATACSGALLLAESVLQGEGWLEQAVHHRRARGLGRRPRRSDGAGREPREQLGARPGGRAGRRGSGHALSGSKRGHHGSFPKRTSRLSGR